VLYRYVLLPIWECCRGAAGDRQPDYNEVLERDDHSDDLYKELNVKALKSLYIRASKEYE